MEDGLVVLPVRVMVQGRIEFLLGLDQKFPGAILALVVN